MMQSVLYGVHRFVAYLLGARDILAHLHGAEEGGEPGTGSATLNRSFERLCMRLSRVGPSFPATFDGVVSKDIRVPAWKNGTNSARLYRAQPPTGIAESFAQTPVVLFIHGGGWTMLDARNLWYDAYCHWLCKELGAVVLSINYRLAPEFPHPCTFVWLTSRWRSETRGSEDSHFPPLCFPPT